MTATRIVRVRDDGPLAEPFRGAVVAIGNFDGVHRGHQTVLGVARDEAEASGRPLVVLTFEPHPRSVFSPDRPVPRLTPARLKARLFEALGVSAVVEQGFDRAYASLPAEGFVARTLVERLGAGHVVVGFDFCFGAKRSGNAVVLREAGERHGFGVSVVEAFSDGTAGVVSSSRIRAALGEGAVEDAAALLGYRFSVEGRIGHGAKLGRTLGYPTANMELPFPELLAHGIYAVRLRRADGTLYDGVASYGRRPTFDDGAPLFETYLFDFSGELYGEDVRVSIVSRLRGEERFDSAEALVEQMDRDAVRARDVLASVRPLSALDRAIAF